MYSIQLQPGERVLRKDRISLTEGKLVNKVGVCFMTDRRLVFQYQPTWMGISILMRVIFSRLIPAWRKVTREVSYQEMDRIWMEKYGINQAVVVPLPDGVTLKVIFSGRQRTAWFEALDQALAGQGLRRVPDGEHAWRVQPG
ncbi:MAG: hypothetical protein D6759_13825 [Chloroflexi bacterium]|nr:MAG: hypothetical protein D6759_13825 [Chloroflexota bacterium]